MGRYKDRNVDKWMDRDGWMSVWVSGLMMIDGGGGWMNRRTDS